VPKTIKKAFDLNCKNCNSFWADAIAKEMKMTLTFTLALSWNLPLLHNGIWTWGLSSSKYISQAVKNCQMHLTEKLGGEYKIPVKADNSSPVDYDPLADHSDPLDAKCASFYQHLIGAMQWMVELGW
jgi:hypothetical protein